jgi:hypothetical protein
MATLRGRLEEFYRRLNALPRPTTADEALEQVCRTLDAVEDELSGIPKASPPPQRWATDGRMYPPQEDSIARSPDGRIIVTTRKHLMEFGVDGSIVIRVQRTGLTEYQR